MESQLWALNSPQLRFAPPQHIVQVWREWAAEGNEWVRDEFFPDRPTLFDPPREQEENHELTQLTPGCREALGRVLAELADENVRLRLRLELHRLRSQTGRRAVPGGSPGDAQQLLQATGPETARLP